MGDTEPPKNVALVSEAMFRALIGCVEAWQDHLEQAGCGNAACSLQQLIDVGNRTLAEGLVPFDQLKAAMSPTRREPP